MSDGIGRGSIGCLTLSVVFLLLGFLEGRDRSPVEEMVREELSGTELDQAPGPANQVPPGDMQTMFRVFKVRLVAEVSGFPIETMEQTSAWGELQQQVAGYDREVERIRREIMQEKLRMSELLSASYAHHSRRGMRMSWFAILFLLGGIAFMVVDAIKTQRAIAEL